MPSSVIEAFASGCAVVSTNAGGVPAILTDGVHGLLVDRNDHKAAAAEVIELIENAVLADRLTSNARTSCEQYTWSAVRDRWLTLYDGMLHETRAQVRGCAGAQVDRCASAPVRTYATDD